MNVRLRHSAPGYRRLLQISQTELFVIVEGRIDRYFAAELCTVTLGHLGVQFDVRMAAELPNGTGGKPGVLEFYDAARRRKELVGEFKGKRTVLTFLLDKDVDDITQRRRRSPHVIYTAHYEIENYLFIHADVTRSIAAVLRIPEIRVKSRLPQDWRRLSAVAWHEWVTLCLLVQMLRVSAEANYGVVSRLNSPCLGPTNRVELARRKADIYARSGLSVAAFDAMFRRASTAVTKRYNSDEWDNVFRGKWYAAFVRQWMDGLGTTWSDDELISALLVSLDLRQGWSAHLVDSLRTLAERSGLIKAA